MIYAMIPKNVTLKSHEIIPLNIFFVEYLLLSLVIDHNKELFYG
jgi:hypothetical protein